MARDSRYQKPTILLIEDEEGIVLTLQDRLYSEGFAVEIRADGITGLERACKPGIDLIILDLMLPGMSGLDICRDLRAHAILTPILMLTARGQTVDRVVGLRMGADDYLGKPFDMSELIARIDAILRRSIGLQSTTLPGIFSPHQIGNSETVREYRFGPFRLDTKTCRLFKNSEHRMMSCEETAHRSPEAIQEEEEIDVPSREFRLLLFFLKRCGHVLTRDELLDSVWGYESIPTTRTVDVHIAWLRQKIEANPQHPVWIETVRGIGYRFSEKVCAQKL